MIVSNAAEYAIRGLSGVAARGSNGSLLPDDVVAGSGIPGVAAREFAGGGVDGLDAADDERTGP